MSRGDRKTTTMRRLLVENHDHPYFTFNVGVRSGSLADPPGKEGLGYLAANMLLRGTARRSQAQIVEDVDVLGSMLDVSVGKEATIVRSDALKRNLDGLVDVLSDVLGHASFPEAELDKLRRQTQAEIKDLRNHDEYLARHFFHQALYDGHPYGRPGKGTVATLEQVTRADVAAFVAEHFRRENLFVAASGALTGAELDELIGRTLNGVADGAPAEAAFPTAPCPQGRSVLLVDKPDRTQTQVILGHQSIDANDPDYVPLLVANTVFGGTFTARLSHEIREKRGWSYGAYSYFSPSRRSGTYSLRFYPNNENTPAAIDLALTLFERLAADGITEEELAFGTSYLINQFPFKIDTTPKRLEQLLSGELLGWPEDFLDRYVDDVRAVTLDGVNAALRRHMHPADLLITVVGTASLVADGLQALPGVRALRVHPYDQDWPQGPPPRGGEGVAE